MPRLEDVDQELAAFAKSDDVLREVVARAIAARRELADLDQALDALRPGGAPVRPARVVESVAPPGTDARPISWDEARASTDAEPQSGALDVDDVSAELPAVLAPPVRPMSDATALYIDPPTNPPPQPEVLALEPDPELGELSADIPVVRPEPPPPAPRPSALPPPNTDAMLAEMLDQPEPPPPPPPPPPPRPTPSVAEDEAAGAVAALMASEDSDFGALDDAYSAAHGGADEVQAERTMMVHADALRPPAGDADEMGEDLEIEIDEDVVVIDEEPAAAASNRSRPPPPPPSRPPEPPKSRPPEPPGKGFLSRILKGDGKKA